MLGLACTAPTGPLPAAPPAAGSVTAAMAGTVSGAIPQWTDTATTVTRDQQDGNSGPDLRKVTVQRSNRNVSNYAVAW